MRAALEDYKRQVRPDVPRELRIASIELEGQIAAASGETASAIRLLNKASRAERALRYTEPPVYPRPVAESLGYFLLRSGKPAQAKSAFRTALEQFPGSARSVAGLRQLERRGGQTVDSGL
jgi:hypothetical protein